MVELVTQCPVCRGNSGQPFYRAAGVPVHSVRLATTAPQAMAVARGDIELYACPECAMVWNRVFDPALMQYDANYEETQGFSSRFQAYHQWLASHLVERYALRDKTVLEIGCGKGEFLALLAALGIGQGIGFDPSFDAARLQGHDRLGFYPAFFPPGEALLADLPKVDLYLCKMTLEHIAQPRDLLEKLAAHIGGRDALLAIQVPALERILDECAWWDIYYEHCNYFSIASLTALLELTGFSVIESEMVFERQYVNIVARSGATLAVHDPHLLEQVDRFGALAREQLEHWKIFLTPAAKRESLLIWGAASKAVALLNALPMLTKGTRLIDINPHKQGTFLPSTQLKIEPPEAMQGEHFELILVANPVYAAEVRAELARLDISGRVVTLGEALPLFP